MEVRRYSRLYGRDELPLKIAEYIVENFEPKMLKVDESKGENPTLDPLSVLTPICKHFKTTMPVLSQRTRKREVVYVRHIAMYLLCTQTSLSLLSIGELFGGFDHTSVIHARDRIAELIPRNNLVKKEIRSLTRKIAS